jgi:low temperature requirement protein LtrA
MLRDPSEEGRTATNLELFFDLVFVVTISVIAGQWHHAITGGHLTVGPASLAVTMFAVWWAWMGFTWFANFFDTDDVPYRLLVFVQLLASLGPVAERRPVQRLAAALQHPLGCGNLGPGALPGRRD